MWHSCDFGLTTSSHKQTPHGSINADHQQRLKVIQLYKVEPRCMVEDSTHKKNNHFLNPFFLGIPNCNMPTLVGLDLDS